ncbi:MAG: hypothetical protein KIC55_02080 [Lachnoanaerobaculum sp.]|jgi:hypothetical protein|uniref:hypothetical protein n=1 Tax=Lachnoanaerobaculum sp. TaxID=2049030 RepID=UPI0025C621E6|nr:hypothetical protein [Lachnoanaerobaculum sp.]MBS5881196.1 hypothetical protein [Lachnoanaerobaculum sp.]
MTFKKTIKQAKDTTKEGLDKLKSNKNITVISLVSSVIVAIVVIGVFSFFFFDNE